MERYATSRKSKMRTSFSRINVGEVIEFVEDGDDHECARSGVKGVVIAKHAGVANGKFFIRLYCSHGCSCTAVRSQIKLADCGDREWN